MNDRKYWCCPDCGRLFWRSLTATTGTSHYCPKHPGVVAIVDEPNINIRVPKNIKQAEAVSYFEIMSPSAGKSEEKK